MGTATIDSSSLGAKYGLTAQEVDLLHRRTDGDKNADIDAAAQEILEERVGPAAMSWKDQPADTTRPQWGTTQASVLAERLDALAAELAEERAKREALEVALGAEHDADPDLGKTSDTAGTDAGSSTEPASGGGK